MRSAIIAVIPFFLACLCTGLSYPRTLRGVHQFPIVKDSFTPSKSVRSALKKAEVIPDVLDDFEPTVSIIISYPSKNKNVELGNDLKPKAVGSEPAFAISDLTIVPTQTSNPNATYVLALTDPDATSRSEPVKGQMCHWIVTNITMQLYSTESKNLMEYGFASEPEIARGSGMVELMTYFPPSPPPKTGYHRYVFVLLTPKTDEGMGKEPKKPKDRPHWGYGTVGAGVREWAVENRLVVVGQ